ncbi:hypothetical protein [Nocardiopsis tropica]|uniref:Uncharacterized protein n=1 Tax=Nocardiopsis tropica TaxID=109330 RepID=A0ABU7KRA9_9ACTN|nr:hypothetical protein [Nocardiopsis umidischolae]MEE2051823.1 hypothetical protein [Nocardiopsis umidischolae]
MGQYRRVGAGQDPYLSLEHIRDELAAEAEDYPAAMEVLGAALAAMKRAGTPVGVTAALARAEGAVEAGGRWGDGYDHVLTVTAVGEEYHHYPRTPDSDQAPDPARPLTLAEVADDIDPADDEFAALLQVLRALDAAGHALAVEAIAPVYWKAEAIVRTRAGARLTIAVGD